jgi:hypothetical protein
MLQLQDQLARCGDMSCPCAEKQAPYHIAGIRGADTGIMWYAIRRYLLRIQRDQSGPRAARLGFNVLN